MAKNNCDYTKMNRHLSFAPVRTTGSKCKFYIDGKDYFQDVYIALDKAKKEVFICDYWFYPYLYLLREKGKPYDDTRGDRLDKLLERKAKQGVKIYIIMWKDIACNYKSHIV